MVELPCGKTAGERRLDMLEKESLNPLPDGGSWAQPRHAVAPVAILSSFKSDSHISHGH